MSEDSIRELNNKLDALLSLVCQVGRQTNTTWSTGWVAEVLARFNLSERNIIEITGAKEDVVRKARASSKMRKEPRRPSFWDNFREQ